MEKTPFFTRRRIILTVAIALLLTVVFAVALSGRHKNITDSSTDTLLDEEGSVPLYGAGELYTAIGENENVLNDIWQDMTLFARTTLGQFKDSATQLSFTFDAGHTMDGTTYVFTGKFGRASDPIKVLLTPHGKGVYTLSITNTKTGANIDNQLSMNGKRNTYIATLPIEKTNYSIRYQLSYDRIVVTFYDGYTAKDVDEAAASVTAGLGSAENKDTAYSINRIGIVRLDDVRRNLIAPLPTP